MSDSKLPFMDEGIHPRVEPVPEGVSSQPLKFSQNSTFKELSKEYTFYTPALLMIYASLPFDIIGQFYSMKNLSTKPYVIVTDEPIFEGLETSQTGGLFNHFLLAIENEHWPELALHLGTIGTRDSRSNTYLGTEIQKLPMADYLALSHHTVLPHPVPMFDMYAIALDGNKACLHFVPATKPPLDKIKLMRSAPNRNIIEYANAVFKGGIK